MKWLLTKGEGVHKVKEQQKRTEIEWKSMLVGL